MRVSSLSVAFVFAAATAAPGVAAADDHGGSISPNSARVKVNHPPKPGVGLAIDPELPNLSAGLETPLRSGRTVRVTFHAEDPDEDQLVYSVDPLPAGATFDEGEGILTWRPTREQEGKHEITFAVTDGEISAKRRFMIVVRPNRAPVRTDESAIFRIAKDKPEAPRFVLGEGESASQIALDPDGDELAVVSRTLPGGARFFASRANVYFDWEPREADVGEHEIVVDVSDGELQTTIKKTVVVIPEWSAHDYRRWLLFGGGPSAFLTHGDGELFLGGTFDATLVALRQDGMHGYFCVHKPENRECHASHHRFYGQFEVLGSARSGAPALFTYGVGYSASLEWYPARRYLIPHYGVDAGGLVRSEVGHRAQVHPYLGLHLWASDDIWVDGTLGYRVVPAELRDLSGPTFALRAIVNPW